MSASRSSSTRSCSPRSRTTSRSQTASDLERVFWDAAKKRALRAREGRYAMVRAGYARVDLAALDALADDASVEDEVLLRAEARAVLDFAATLEPTERRVWACRAAGRRRTGCAGTR